MAAPSEMKQHHQIEVGPALRAVLGDDALAGTHDPDHCPEGVSHLRPVAAGRDIMVLHQRESRADSLTELADRLLWLDGRAGAPEMIASGRNDELEEALVIRMPTQAVVASDPFHPIDPESLARLIGTSLGEVHAVETNDCPFESSVSRWRAKAAARVQQGEIEVVESGPYARLTPDHLLDVLDELIGTTPTADDDVLIHGLAATDHLWVVPSGSIVFTGWQMCGVGNRHHDLAVAAASLTGQFGAALVPPMLEAYGLDLVDLRQLDMHQLLVYLAGVAT